MAGQRPGTPKGPGADAGGLDGGPESANLGYYYRVRPGDTLWGIAQLTLGNGQRDGDIYQLNVGHVLDGYKLTDENLIYPHMTLRMPTAAKGQPGVYASTDGGVTATGTTPPPHTGNGRSPTRRKGSGRSPTRRKGSGRSPTRRKGSGRKPTGSHPGGTAGGDTVTVDLAMAGAAAQSLEALRTALDANVQMLQNAVSQLNAHGASLQLPGPQQQLRGRAPSDAADMRAAYQIAERMNNQLPPTRPIDTYGSINIGVIWNTAALGKAAAEKIAPADAAALAVFSRAGHPTPAQRTALAQAIVSLTDETDAGNTAYLKTFWSQPGIGPAAGNLAHVLSQEDGQGLTLLSKTDQRILASVGTGLASAAKAGVLPQDVQDAFTHADGTGLWSAGALIKYGPGGAAYGTGQGATFLAAMGRTMLDHAGQMFSMEPLPAGPGTVAVASIFDPNGGMDRIKQYQQAEANSDVASSVLSTAAQNIPAAAQLLGGPGGSKYVSILMHTQWNTGGGYDMIPTGDYQPAQLPFSGVEVSDGPAELLVAAASDLGSRASAQATMNIIRATPPSTNPVSGNISEALAVIAGMRVNDFAAAALNSYSGVNPQQIEGHWLAPPSHDQLDNFFKQAFANHPELFGSYQAFIYRQLAGTLAMQRQYPHSKWVKSMGALVGKVVAVNGELNFKEAQKAAQSKAFWTLMGTLALPLIMLIPTPAPEAAAAAVLGVAATEEAGAAAATEAVGAEVVAGNEASSGVADAAAADAAAAPVGAAGGPPAPVTGTLTRYFQNMFEQDRKPGIWGPAAAKFGVTTTENSGIYWGMSGGDEAQALYNTDQIFVAAKGYAEVAVCRGLAARGMIPKDQVALWEKNGQFNQDAFSNWYQGYSGEQVAGLGSIDNIVQEYTDGIVRKQ